MWNVFILKSSNYSFPYTQTIPLENLTLIRFIEWKLNNINKPFGEHLNSIELTVYALCIASQRGYIYCIVCKRNLRFALCAHWLHHSLFAYVRSSQHIDEILSTIVVLLYFTVIWNISIFTYHCKSFP